MKKVLTCKFNPNNNIKMTDDMFELKFLGKVESD